MESVSIAFQKHVFRVALSINCLLLEAENGCCVICPLAQQRERERE